MLNEINFCDSFNEYQFLNDVQLFDIQIKFQANKFCILYDLLIPGI